MAWAGSPWRADLQRPGHTGQVAIELLATVRLDGDPTELTIRRRQLGVAYSPNIQRPAGKISER